MHRNRFIELFAAVVLAATLPVWAAQGPYDPNRARGPVRVQVANPNIENRVHDKGKMCMNITNYGYFGNNGPEQSDAIFNPCPPGDWAPQCEYPCGSNVQYLFQGALWIGALIVEQGFETKRVSVGTDGWLNPAVNEFYPGEGVNDGIIERSTRPGSSNCLGVPISSPDAVSDQDFLCVMADTLTDDFWLVDDALDGPHRPLGIKIRQTSYAFSQAFAEDFILIDYEIENIASNFLKNLYVGLYVDADVGPAPPDAPFGQHEDDICGFRRNTMEVNAHGDSIAVPINIAWIADNDGRNKDIVSGPMTCPNVTGTRVVRAPNPRLQTSFNWWISNGSRELDFGPTWASRCTDADNPYYYFRELGTPMGDQNKYLILSNTEFDYDQIMVDNLNEVAPDTNDEGGVEPWCTAGIATNASDIADGFDTRYLLSWGPLGVRDYQDATGRWIYRLNPGEKFNMTIAYIGGELLHDPSNPQPSNTNIDSSLFNWADMDLNAKWAKDVYDNRMTDTPQWDWGIDHTENTNDPTEGDGILETGDGWFGEDVGTDGLYAELPAGVDSVEVIYWKGTTFATFAGWYKGPDADGTERNGFADPVNNIYLFPESGGAGNEDHIMPEDLFYLHPKYRFWDMGWMSGNDALDQGDGLPDFTGPPPPRLPSLLHCIPNTNNAAQHFGGQLRFAASGDCYVGGMGYELGPESVTLRWSKKASEDPTYTDPFSRVQDFEGYRVHRGNTPIDTSFSLLAEFDVIDFAWFSPNDSLMTIPFITDRPDTIVQRDSMFTGGVLGTLKPVGNNTGLNSLVMDDSTYQFVVSAHTLAPVYYSVTAFDFGDPKAGLGPLSTRPSANAVFLAPSGTTKEPVRVVPNPYRAYEDYTQASSGISWENQNDGTREFFSQVDRRIEFINLPRECIIRIFTTAGDLVQIVPHNVPGDKSQWASETSERWDLNSRNRQQVVSGIYLFSVEDLTGGNGYNLETGKFVIIR